MRHLFLIALSMIYGCARPNPIELYRKIESNKYTHQCNLPIFYGMDKSIPEELKPVITKAFNYWDSLFEYNLFFYIGDNLDEEIVNSGAVTTVSIVKKDNSSFDKSVATTYISSIYNENGCMPNTKIKINDSILIFNDNSVETVIRHEVGHSLGFDDSNYAEDLMFGSIDMMLYIDEPKGISEWERKAFEIYYKK